MYKIKKKLREYSNKNKIIKLVYIYINSIFVFFTKNLSDSRFAKVKYRHNTGRELSLDNPQLFNEKLWWLKLNNRDPLMTKCSDKVEVRKYVIDNGLGHILNEVYGVFLKPEDISFESIPDKAYIKTTHGSGKNMIFHKDDFNYKKFKRNFRKSLSKNYYYQSREWNYKNIIPRILIEKNLNPDNKYLLADYRFLCFDGHVKYVFVDIETANTDGSHYFGAKRNVYDRDFNLLDIRAHRDNFDPTLLEKPTNWTSMIEYAEILSRPFVFCRVDLYNIEGDIFFGEITFYPGGATQSITPSKYEIQLGRLIDLESKKIVKSGEN